MMDLWKMAALLETISPYTSLVPYQVFLLVGTIARPSELVGDGLLEVGPVAAPRVGCAIRGLYGSIFSIFHPGQQRRLCADRMFCQSGATAAEHLVILRIRLRLELVQSLAVRLRSSL